MKKITYLFFPFILLILASGCAGYKPIFNSENLKFDIAEYSIVGDKMLGNKIYSQLHNLSKSQKSNVVKKSIILKINSTKTKTALVKDSAGKISEYKIILKINIEVLDYLTNSLIFNQTFTNSIIYKTQSQFSETLKLENQSINDLIAKTYRDILLKISGSLT